MGITVEAKDISTVLAKLEREMKLRLKNGIRRGAARGRGILVRRTPVDTGQAKAGWMEQQGFGDVLWKIVNDAPHIGIIENGARPHAVSDVGILAIEQWVSRHPDIVAQAQDSGARTNTSRPSARASRMLTVDQAIKAVTMGIVWKLRHEGQRPTYFIKNSMEDLREAMASEVSRELRSFFKNPPGKR